VTVEHAASAGNGHEPQAPGEIDPGRIFVDPAAYADPVAWHAAAARLRRESPVHRVAIEDREPFWALTRYADVMDVERHPEIFTNAPLPALALRRPPVGATELPVKTLVQMDGDEHKVHRGLVNTWFKPGSVRRRAEAVAALARRSVDAMARRTECDFAQDVANQFPLQVILSILGLPEADYPRMLRLTQELFGSDDPDLARLAEDDAAIAVIMDFLQYFSTLTAQRRERPGDDLASVIATATLEGAPLGDLEKFGFYLIIATAGHDTTSSAIAGGMLALLEHPEQLALLQAHPELIDSAADELVRWVSPVKHFMRTAQHDAVIGGTEIARGDWLLLSYPSANRDEAVFARPDEFDVTRPDADRSLAFGFGAHYCLGAHLAKLEIRSFFRELIPRIEHMELVAPARHVQAVLVSGPKTIPVRYRLRG
jgi:cytochrome P450